VTPELFRSIFREFAEPDTAPDDAIDFYIGLAQNFLNGSNSSVGQRWDASSLDYGIGLFVAHHIALSQRAVATAQAGGIPGDVRGPATAKAIDKVSTSYDTKAVTWENEAFWSQTTYGIRLIDLARMFGAGGVQLGVCGGGISNGTWPIFSPYWPE
jgi:hypothetical protein